MRAAVDTSLVIAALLSWHQHHPQAREALEPLLKSNHEVILPARVLIESFSVMTRLPAPHRLDPADAVAALEGTFRTDAKVTELGCLRYWRFLRGLPGHGVRGGAVYDAEIIECARRSKADVLVTMNRRDFERLADDATFVVGPEELERLVPEEQ
ncbi:MAG: PIN domain-containing protein [Acidobacteriota bacterium]